MSLNLGVVKFLIAFKQVLTKILPAVSIQLHNYDLFEKARLKLGPFIQNSVQLDCLPESYTSPSYQKCFKTVASMRCGLLPPPLNLYGKPWGWEKILPNNLKFTRFPHQKNPP